jgi:hypothetical protein
MPLALILRRLLFGLAALPVSFALSSCGSLPGTTFGTYSARATLDSNTCGPGIGAPDPWEFDVLLSQTGSTLFWSWEDGSPLLSGVLVAGHATLATSEVDNVDTKDGGVMGPCDLQRHDDLVLTMGPGSPPPSFQGTVSYTFSVQEGTVCTDQLSASGGMYRALPCSVSYTVAATHE